MEIRELMSTDVCSCVAADSLRDVAMKMQDHDCGCLPVCDGERPIGMVTDRDILLCAVRTDQPLSRLSAQQAMTHNITRCKASDSIEEVERLMRTAQIRRLPVVDGSGALTGLISLADLARSASGAKAKAVKVSDLASTLSGICLPRAAP
jgi:CBS domain-containing protein